MNEFDSLFRDCVPFTSLKKRQTLLTELNWYLEEVCYGPQNERPYITSMWRTYF